MTEPLEFWRFTVAKSGSCGPAASVMACITDIIVMWSVYEMIRILLNNSISNTAILL